MCVALSLRTSGAARRPYIPRVGSISGDTSEGHSRMARVGLADTPTFGSGLSRDSTSQGGRTQPPPPPPGGPTGLPTFEPYLRGTRTYTVHTSQIVQKRNKLRIHVRLHETLYSYEYSCYNLDTHSGLHSRSLVVLRGPWSRTISVC